VVVDRKFLKGLLQVAHHTITSHVPLRDQPAGDQEGIPPGWEVLPATTGLALLHTGGEVLLLAIGVGEPFSPPF